MVNVDLASFAVLSNDFPQTVVSSRNVFEISRNYIGCVERRNDDWRISYCDISAVNYVHFKEYEAIDLFSFVHYFEFICFLEARIVE